MQSNGARISLIHDEDINVFAARFLDWFAARASCVKPRVIVWVVPQSEWKKLLALNADVRLLSMKSERGGVESECSLFLSRKTADELGGEAGQKEEGTAADTKKIIFNFCGEADYAVFLNLQPLLLLSHGISRSLDLLIKQRLARELMHVVERANREPFRSKTDAIAYMALELFMNESPEFRNTLQLVKNMKIIGHKGESKP
jgi:hypothetical protein